MIILLPILLLSTGCKRLHAAIKAGYDSIKRVVGRILGNSEVWCTMCIMPPQSQLCVGSKEVNELSRVVIVIVMLCLTGQPAAVFVLCVSL